MRAVLLAAALLLAAACSSPSPTPSGDTVRILATDLPTIGVPFTIHLVTDSSDFMDGWRATGRPGSPPPVDFATEVAIYFGMAGSSSCPITFQRLVVDRDSARVYADWDDGSFANMPCTADLAPQGVVIAVSRAALPEGQFTLSLRETFSCQNCTDHPDWARVQVR